MTDEEYVALSRGGEKYAEEYLLNKYTPLVRSVAARFFLFGGEAEDLFQEGMVGLHSAVSSFEEGCGAKFASYAYKCIHNAVVDAVKKSGGAKNSALNNFVPIVEICDEVSRCSPEDELIRSENRREFLQKISGVLSSLEFKAVVMRLDGTSVQEISAALNKPIKSVSNALARAKVKLLKLYRLTDNIGR